MEKEALIDIILNDIKEVHTLVNTFKGKNELNAAFINLTRTKIANINEELALLEQLNDEKGAPKNSESSLTSEGVNNSIEEDNSAIAESSSRFAEGESAKVDIPSSSHSETPSSHSEISPKLSETSSDLSEIPSKASEKSPKPSEASPKSSAIPSEHSETIPRHSETSPSNSEVSPSSSETSPNSAEMSSNHSEITSKSTEISPKPSEVTTRKKGTKSNTKSTVLGEVIKKDSSSVNEAIANKKEQVEDIKQIGKPVSDVKKAFGLNDRFYFQRELFDNNADLFNQTLDQINHMDSYDSAVSFLQSNYSWEADNEATESFYKSIKRRFI